MDNIVAGVDGCKVGWIVVKWDMGKHEFTLHVAPDFFSVRSFAASVQIIAMDIPIGLLDQAVEGGRACDRLARKMLGKRASSVFAPPVRASLECATYPEALKANRDSSPHAIGISKQCFAILPKIREVDRIISPDIQRSVIEVHPELCFRTMNNDQILLHTKKTRDGLEERKALLTQHGFGTFITQALASRIDGAAPDDLLDACAACWTAQRKASGLASQIPSSPSLDSKGLRMEMWY
jgi:predicted RNase H-like nuclease